MAQYVDSTGARFEHVKVSAPDQTALPTTNILNLPIADSMDLTYDGSGLLTNITYKNNGATVGTMTLTYSGQLVTNVTVNNLVD